MVNIYFGGEDFLEIIIETWGDFACFSPPYAKVERMTYPFPTPSAARGILSAIYSKPVEFYWQVKRIEVLKPIKYISFKRNEVICTISEKKPEPIYVLPLGEYVGRVTQRQTVALQDVRYRIVAEIKPRDSFKGSEAQLYEQALRRIRAGKCFYQPSFGCREFTAYFEESDGILPPISESLDLGLMVYDVFDLHDYSVSKKAKPYLTLFHAKMVNGVIEIPPYDSSEVIRGGK